MIELMQEHDDDFVGQLLDLGLVVVVEEIDGRGYRLADLSASPPTVGVTPSTSRRHDVMTASRLDVSSVDDPVGNADS